MNRTITGTFEVKLTPAEIEGERLGRMIIFKRFHGPLEAESQGQMLSASGEVKGSAVYVAVERVTGALEGKTGSFVLHHRGVMDRGQPSLSVAVAPDSGTGELAGLTGEMTIRIEAGQHFYEFVYSLPNT
jgi:hypothetical protein